MMTHLSSMRMRATALLLVASLALTSCFISPGKFTSALDLKNDGSFAFTYDGEIFFLGLSELAKMGNSSAEFSASECYDDDTFEERDCTEADLAQQRAEWKEQAERKAAKAEKDAKEMSALMGGIDPSDPEANEELRQLLLRQKGWNKVEAVGNGVFEVEFAAEGQLSHDLMFPVIEGFPSANMFVQVILREGNVVRVNAPGFSADNDANPMGPMLGGMSELSGLAALSKGDPEGEEVPEAPVLDGTFTITTDGQILANNTDEGPANADGGSTLLWEIDSGTKAAPTALIKLGG
ncbi:MAG: hypothetical protein ABJ239_04065 [Erythrobacter sp.]